MVSGFSIVAAAVPLGAVPLVAALLVAVSLVALVLAWRDLRILRAREKALESQLATVRNALKRRSDLANEVAHEIKNPLTAILCSAETLDLLIGDQVHPDHRKSLHYICDYGHEVLRLLSDYLDVSRVESGFVEPKPVPTDVRHAVESVQGLLRSFAQRQRVEVVLQSESEDVWADADPRMLKQIVFNLIHNAVKFSPPGEIVEVSMMAVRGGTSVDVLVRDYGPGIDPSLLGHLFSPDGLGAIRRQTGGSGEGCGYGLGLALVKLLVELSGGLLRVDTEPGLGSLFAFSLPAAAAPSRPEPPPFESRAGLVNKPLLGQTFLLVDGDARTPETVSRLIEAWGGVVDRVSEASQAIQALAERRYDAVMIDDPADGAEGSELARALREDGRARDTTIIIASVDPVAPNVAKDGGADRCIAKPFSGHMLLDSLLRASKSQITH